MDTRSVRLREFHHLAEEVRAHGARQGLAILPWRDPSLPHFSRLPEDQQVAVLNHLGALSSAMGYLVKNDRSFFNTIQIMIETLKRIAISPSPDILDRLEEDDFIIAYNKHQHMIFVSPNHFMLTSYSLEDLYCRRWMDLFHRHDMIIKVLVDRATKISERGQAEPIFNNDIPPHSLVEIETAERRAAICWAKLYSPIFLGGRIFGFMSVNRLKETTLELTNSLPSQNHVQDGYKDA